MAHGDQQSSTQKTKKRKHEERKGPRTVEGRAKNQAFKELRPKKKPRPGGRYIRTEGLTRRDQALTLQKAPTRSGSGVRLDEKS